MKIKLNAARRLLAAEQDPQSETLKRQLEVQKDKPAGERTLDDKRAMLNTQDQLDRKKESVKQQKDLGKSSGSGTE